MVDLSRRWPLGLGEKRWWVSVVLALGALALALVYDEQISAWAQALPPEVIDFFEGLTRYGESDWILIPAGIFMVVTGAVALLVRWKLMRTILWQFTSLYAFIFVGVGLPSLFTTLVKRAIGRGRPIHFEEFGTLHFQPNWWDWTYQSFPSGHSTTVFALAAAIGMLSARWFYAAMVFAVAVAFSRVAVGMHYPSDVLAGAIVGTLGAYLVRLFFATRGWSFRVAPDGDIEGRPISSLRRYLVLKRRDSERVRSRGPA